jgi:hypothetical protein
VLILINEKNDNAKKEIYWKPSKLKKEAFTKKER